MPTGPTAKSQSGSRRKLLETELDEQKQRYDVLTERIKAIDSDLGQAMDGEQRLTLRERRKDLVAERKEVVANMEEIESQLAVLEEGKQVVERPPDRQVASAPADAGRGERKPVVQVEAAAPDLLTLSKPFLLELIRIPAGEFLMGSDPGRDEDAEEDEQPQHLVYLPEYTIGKYPITNAQYEVFVQAQGYEPPEHWEKGGIPAGKRQHPVVYVSRQDAMAFCTWLSERAGREFRLPSEAEWEKAARGVDGRIYPWGDEITPEHANYGASGVGDTSAVGRYPKGKSPYGALDMAGNVWEWCLTKWQEDYILSPDEDAWGEDACVVRGGSFRYIARFVRCAYRLRNFPHDRSINFGFRVVCVSPPS